MNKRKSHTKSRLGCTTCKRRHVKCDEQQPLCAPCKKLGLHCQWPSASIPKTAASDTTDDAEPNPQMIDMVLLQHWTLYTSATLYASSHNAERVWQSHVVQLGFEHHYLLWALLSVSALHKALSMKTDIEGLYERSLTYMDLALSGMKDDIQQPSLSTCSPVFATACLLVVHSMAIVQIRPQDDPISAAIEWIQLVKGVSTTLRDCWEQILTMEIAPLITAARLPAGVNPSMSELSALQHFVSEAEYISDEHRSACVAAAADLHLVLSILLEHQDDQDHSVIATAFYWPAKLSPTYLELAKAHHPTALVILAHFVVCFEQQKSPWFTHGWARLLVTNIERSLPAPLHKWLAWPISHLQT